MDQSTPKDFLFHFSQGNYQAALDICKEFELDTDVVYKTQWTHATALSKPPSAEDVDLLTHINDDAWVVAQCLDAIVNDWGLQHTILTLGRSRTAHHTSESTGDSLWHQCQLYLNNYLDRLETFIEIWPSLKFPLESFGSAYADFRDSNLVALAVDYARQGNSVALRSIFSHHRSAVWPFRFAILAEIPETASPDEFDLPRVSDDNEEDEWMTDDPWRETENSEGDKNMTSAAVGNTMYAPEHIDYLAWVHTQWLSSPVDFPAPANTICEWYLSKAAAADKMGLCGQALEWARYARLTGAKGLEQKEVQYDWLCRYVYSCNLADEKVTIRLEEFEQIPSYEVLEGLLRHTNESRIVSDMKQLVLPWLAVCADRGLVDEEVEESGPETLLYRWLLGAAEEHLYWVCLVLEQSKPTLLDEERIIKNDKDLARLALAVLYSTHGPIDLQVRIFECLPVFDDVMEDGMHTSKNEQSDESMMSLLASTETALGLFTALEPVDTQCLTQMMDTLQTHLSSAEVLARYHAGVPLQWFLKDHSGEEQRQLCIRMASQAAGGVETGGRQFDNDDDWRELLVDMMDLHGIDDDGVFGRLSRTEIFEMFFTSLLRCGRFRLAKDLMVGPGRDKTLDIGRAEQLVIDAEQEFFDNATTGDMHTGNMKLAMDCLKILPLTDLVNEEMELIEATHTLIYDYHVMDRPGIELMPIQVRQSSDRLGLIAKLIHTRRGIYKQPEDVLVLAKKLGYQDDKTAEVKVLAMLANEALIDEDYDIAYKLCHDTVENARTVLNDPVLRRRHNVDEVSEAAWQICFNLGKLGSYTDYPRRYDVLAMALELSPVQHVRDVLIVWRQLDKEHPDPSQLDFITPGSTRYAQDDHHHHRLDAIKNQVIGFLWNRLSKP